MLCPKCKSQLPAGAVACAKCGTRFKTKTCPQCKSVILASASACPRCGKRLGQGAVAAAPAAAASASSQSKGGFRWWYILIGLGIFVLGVACGAIGAGGAKQDKTKGEKVSAVSSSDSSQVLTDKINLDGTWKQTNTKSETNYHAAVITGSTIEIYWINEDESSRSLYWAGTVTIPEEPASEFSWDSANDKSKTENAILASGDTTKTFSYKDGKISYEASAMGTTTTVQLEKTEASIPGLEASSKASGNVNSENSTEVSQDSENNTPSADVPREYLNALQKAKNYSDNMAMSKQGIYDQLVSEYGENFPAEAAQYAIDNLDADYKSNALIKAKTYYENMDMSKEAVREQLVSEYGEKFTQEEADYAVANLE